ncbi:MAG: DEAD/DEAH box helicase [Candidatus Binatia bacterium]|nr:DEAD/DEAH box helicase [Candidatus Binatia bacterium]
MHGTSFSEFFERLTGFPSYRWQAHVAEEGFPDLLHVPTGLGKTEGAALAWAWRRLHGYGEPRHLVYCLPMRVLVRQTVERLRSYFAKLPHPIPVYSLLGGDIEEEWAGEPEHLWVLVGTQDQLLSRALNRGYAMSRFEWPVHFGFLNNDCRWIIDEVQLMGPGLWTTAQLDWMRRKRFSTVFACPTTWMSATVGTAFLATVDRTQDGCAEPNVLPLDLIANDGNPEFQRRQGARKSIRIWKPQAARSKNTGEADFYATLVRAIAAEHVRGTLSLVVCNTVEAARRIFQLLPRDDVPKVLLTARFRRQDRDAHEQRLLEFERKRRLKDAERAGSGREQDCGKPLPEDPGLICVSTQVVEAGLDISAHHLWSEMAPWASTIQRLGRLNRDGRDPDAKAWFWKPSSDRGSEKQGRLGTPGPYDPEDIALAEKLLSALARQSGEKPFVEALRELEKQLGAELRLALEPKPEPMPRAVDVHGLFSTERDVHGGFTDISPFVRGDDIDADVTVVWRDWPGGPNKNPPVGEELDGPPLDIGSEGCPVPFFRLRAALEAWRVGAWVWNDEEERWETVAPDGIRPGMVVMLHREAGGYDADLGWTGERAHQLPRVPRAGRGQALRDEERSETGYWARLDVHLGDARREAESLCDSLGLQGQIRTAVVVAAGLHDLGKAHPQWQGALQADGIEGAGPWAKCPRVLAVEVNDVVRVPIVAAKVRELRCDSLQLSPESRLRNQQKVLRLRFAVDEPVTREELEQIHALPGVVWAGHAFFRPNMRHEAASALAMWQRYRAGLADYPALAVYLAAAHHGKVRTVFRSLTELGDDAFGVPVESAPLSLNGEAWLLDFSVVKDGAEGDWLPDGFALHGHGWTGLVSDLLGPWHPDDRAVAGVVPKDEPRKLGPFQLAYLEALVRVADRRASARPSQCTRPSEVAHG